MSENESFIDEVTEEVRRDKLYLFLKKYGWIPALGVILIVATSIVVEIRNNSLVLESEKRGDILAQALITNEEGKINFFDISEEFTDDSALIPSLLKSKLFEQNQNLSEAMSAYESLLNNTELNPGFRNFVKFKLLLLLKDDPVRSEELLGDLIAPDNAFRLLALEQKVLKQINEGSWEKAQKSLYLIKNDPNSSQSLLSRVDQIQKVISVVGSSS